MWYMGRSKEMDTRVLVNLPKWKIPLGRPRLKWGGNIKVDTEK
jgi:hypothetical protein